MARQPYRACWEQARIQAAALLAQGRKMTGRREPESAPMEREQEEPMNRYTHPIPAAAPRCGTGAPEIQACLERVLEGMACQNQLLVDLLGAVNALTAAVLSTRSHS